MWLSHHWPEDSDRCITVGRWQVCRRCAVVYPLAAATIVAAAVLGVPWVLLGVVAVLAPVPAVVELAGERLGWWRHSPRRLVAVSVALGVGLGAAFARYLARPSDPLFWAVVISYGGLCLVLVLVTARRQGGPPGPD